MIGIVLLCKQVVESLSLHETSNPDVDLCVECTYAVSPIETLSTKTEKASNKPTTSTATKSTSRVR